MRSAITLATQLIVLALTTGSAAAHSGHGISGASSGFSHYATEPQHLGAGAAAALLAALSIAAVRKARSLRPQRMALPPRTPRRHV